MKVLQINTVCGIGSTGRIALEIHRGLTNLGHESGIAYGRQNAIGISDAIKIGNKLDNYSHLVETRLFDRHGLGSLKATNRLIEEVTKIDPDIIHLHNIHGYYLNIRVLFNYLKTVGKPIVWTLHDCWSFTGHCVYFDRVGCNKWKTLCEKCPQKKEYPSSIILDNSKMNFKLKKELFSNMDNLHIVTPSKWLFNLVKKSFLSTKLINVINNGINLDVFKPSQDNNIVNSLVDIKKFVILGVSNNWSERKGFKHFLDLSNTLRDDEIIILIGVNEKQKSILPPNIIGIKRTQNIEEMVGLYTRADVFVNPTLEDNFPTTNLEALSCGTPIITFDTGGSVESIDKNTGLITMTKDAEGLRNSLDRLRSNIEVYHAGNCINKAKTEFSTNRMVSGYIKLYKKIIGDI